MKRCPQCNRTYDDEAISFCLADGQLLSPSFDSAATLPLRTPRSTAEETTRFPPAEMTPERARLRIRRFWIVGVIVTIVGFGFSLIVFTNEPAHEKPPLVGLVTASAISGLLYGYFGWSVCWGMPVVWRWWRRPTKGFLQFIKDRIEFNWAVILVLILGILCLLAPALILFVVCLYLTLLIGFIYSVFGGGIYQFLQMRKIAKTTLVSEN